MKKKFTITVLALTFTCVFVYAQNIFPASGAAGIGTTTPNASSSLDIVSTSTGVLMPRMTLVQRNAIISAAAGLLIYQTNSAPGFYYYTGTAWKAVTATGANTTLSNLTGATAINADLKPKTDNTFDLGKTDSAWKNLYLKGAIFIGGQQLAPNFVDNSIKNGNTFLGSLAGQNTTTGTDNITLGNLALNQNETGTDNIAIGDNALFLNQASGNSAVGSNAMVNSTTGYDNCAFGYQTLYNNAAGFHNNAFGYQALYSNTGAGLGGSSNNAFGYQTLHYNTTGHTNSAFGEEALSSNKTGNANVAIGVSALIANVSADNNTAVGSESMLSNTTGTANAALGFGSLWNNTTGGGNTAIGDSALYANSTLSNNTAIGFRAGNASKSSASTYLGYNAQASVAVSNSTAVGANAIVTANNQVMLGNTAITSVKAAGSFVIYSDGRFKNNIKENVPGLEFIKLLRPVTYNYNIHALNNYMSPNNAGNAATSLTGGNTTDNSYEEAIQQKEKKIYTGFVAQDVEAAANKLSYDFSGVYKPQNNKDAYGLSYSDFVVPLVKAVQELAQQNEELKNRLDKIETMLAENSKTSGTVTIKQMFDMPKLEQNFPNPYNGTTTIKYFLPANTANAFINFYSSNGNILRSVKITGEGNGNISFSGNQLASGVYSYSLIVAGKLFDTKQMVYAK